MCDPTTTSPPADLSVAALRYAAGDMTAADAEAFEARLGADQTARDALAEAVRLSAAASGLPAPTPDPLVRVAVAERLNPTWVSRLFARRPYRGHPATWAGLGGGVAAFLTVAVVLNLAPDTVNPRVVGPAPNHSSFAATAGLEDAPGAPADAATATRVQPLPLPPHPNLNPMGMDPQPGDTAVAGPMTVPTPATLPTPMVAPTPMPAITPATKPAANSVAEGSTDPAAPKAGDPVPNIGGMIMSRL